MRIEITNPVNENGREYLRGVHDVPEETARHLLTMPWAAKLADGEEMPSEPTSTAALSNLPPNVKDPGDIEEGPEDAEAHSPSLGAEEQGKVLLTIVEAGEVIGRTLGKKPSRSAMYRMMDRCEIASVRLGGRRLIPEAALKDYLQQATDTAM